MNDNPRPSLFARIRGWIENTQFYKNMHAKTYDAPARSYWWIGMRLVLIAALFCISLSAAYYAGLTRRGTSYIQHFVAVEAVASPDMIHKSALDAWKARTADCEAMARGLDGEVTELRSALAALPPLPPETVLKAETVVAKKPKRVVTKQCDTWVCKVDKLVTDPGSAIGQ